MTVPMTTGRRRRTPGSVGAEPDVCQPCTRCIMLCATPRPAALGATMDLRDPQQFSRIYDDHHRSVFAAAQRVLNDHALASDVVQDVFLRLWRRPQSFDASRGDVGTYLRLMARSRAVDLWREGQARGRMGDRLKVVTADEPPRTERPEHVLERAHSRE